MSVDVTVSGTSYALPTAGDPYWRPSVTTWGQAVSTAIAAGGGFSVSDTATVDLTLSTGVLSGIVVAGSLTNTHINSSAAIALSKIAQVASGVYTPTLTNVANLDGSTAFECQYLRLGIVVTVSGKVSLDPTLLATSTQLGISIPISSNFGAAEDCAGVAFASGIVGQGAAILADVTNDRAQLQFISGDTTNQAMFFTFSYTVI